jgi:membrane-associated phospholipid phosphatase
MRLRRQVTRNRFVRIALFAGALSTNILVGLAGAGVTDGALTQSLPEAPPPRHGAATAPDELSLKRTPRRLVEDECHIIASPAHIGRGDLRWLLPLAGVSALAIATDTSAMRNVVSRNPDFNSANSTFSDISRDLFLGAPVLLFGAGELANDSRSREAGLLAGEAMVNAFVTSEGIKYIMLRERPAQNNARGHFFSGDAASDPSFVSGHSIVAWSSAAVLAGEYSKPWQQVGIYTAATSVSLTRVLAQQHFPSDVLLGSVSGWLIGHYVLKHHRRTSLGRSG